MFEIVHIYRKLPCNLVLIGSKLISMYERVLSFDKQLLISSLESDNGLIIEYNPPLRTSQNHIRILKDYI